MVAQEELVAGQSEQPQRFENENAAGNHGLGDISASVLITEDFFFLTYYKSEQQTERNGKQQVCRAGYIDGRMKEAKANGDGSCKSIEWRVVENM